MSTLARVLLAASSILAAAVLPGCQSPVQFAADLRNNTPQPLYANILERTNTGTFVRASERLGPGDRGAVGPVMITPGYAVLQLDTKPNPLAPWSMDLSPGVTILEVTQTGEGVSGQLQVRPIGP